VVVVKLVAVRSGQPTQSTSISLRTPGAPIVRRPHQSTGLDSGGTIGRASRPLIPILPSHWRIREVRESPDGHHHQTVSNACALFAREEVCRCEGRSEGVERGGGREKGRKGERETRKEKRTVEEQEHRKNIVGGQCRNDLLQPSLLL